MAITSSYNYNVELSLLLEDEVVSLDRYNITSIVIDSDYDKNTMPAIIVGLRISPTIYNKFVLNSDSAFVSAKIYKYDSNAVGFMDLPYISDRFVYKMTDNPNYNESLLDMKSTNDELSDSTFNGYIALLSQDSINSNKKLYNGVVKNTDLLSLIVNYTNHLDICIEPFDNNPEISQFIIPPITSLTNLLQYINQNFYFYTTGYRYFRDFNMAYLLSSSGHPVNTTDDTYSSILINIVDPSLSDGYDEGVELDDKSKSYIINVSASSTSLDKNKYMDSTFNSILGVDDEGNTNKVVLDIPSNPESTEKVLLKRILNNNMEYVGSIKSSIESKSIIVTVTKKDIDASILTPNKEYFIKNYKDNSDYDGRFVLSYKKEVLIQSQDGFVSNVVFGLRKVFEDSI